jgi:flagellar secretion chaperone FliS
MNALHQYQSVNRQTGVVDADRHRLIQMLFDGALERISMAKGLIQRKDYEGKNRLIAKAIEIVAGLRSFLDIKNGGEVATNLERLYEYMEYRLFEANMKNDMDALDEVASHIRTVKNGWDGIRDEVKQKGLI